MSTIFSEKQEKVFSETNIPCGYCTGNLVEEFIILENDEVKSKGNSCNQCERQHPEIPRTPPGKVSPEIIAKLMLQRYQNSMVRVLKERSDFS